MVEANLVSLEAIFALVKDSDSRGSAIDAFNRAVRTPCLTSEQARRLLVLAGTARAQAHKEEDSFKVGIAGLIGLLTSVSTWVRVAEAVGGAALVYMGTRSLITALGSPVTLPTAGQVARVVTRT